MSSVRHSTRVQATTDAARNKKKLANVTAVVDAIRRHKTNVGNSADSDMDWMSTQLQLFQSRARACAGAAIVSTASSGFATAHQEPPTMDNWDDEKERIGSLLVKELRAELSHAGLSTEGKKCVLRNRLRKFMRERFQEMQLQQQDNAKKDDPMDVEKVDEEEEKDTEAAVVGVSKQVDVPYGAPHKNLSPIEETESSPEEQALASQELGKARKIMPRSAAEKPLESFKAPPKEAPSKMSIDEADKVNGGKKEPADGDTDMLIDEAHLTVHSPKKAVDNDLHGNASAALNVNSENCNNNTEAILLHSNTKTQSTSNEPSSGSDRKRSRSPFGSVRTLAMKFSPNKSGTKVQKKDQHSLSQTKKRYSSMDVEMTEIEEMPKEAPKQASFLRPSHSASHSKLPPAPMAGGAPRVFQDILYSNKVFVQTSAEQTGSGSGMSEKARKKQEERKERSVNMQKYARTHAIRAKSKPVAPAQALPAQTQTFMTFKKAGDAALSTTKHGTTNTLTEHIRAKSKIADPNNVSTLANGVDSSALTSGAKAVPVASIYKTHMAESLKAQAAPGQPTIPVKKIAQASPAHAPSVAHQPTPPSPFDTYEMSDGEQNSVDSEDEGERKKRNEKYIPNWARGEKLKSILAKQHSRKDDPDDTFLRVATCDLQAIFGKHEQKDYYNSRNSTGDWGDDRSQPLEHLVPKRGC